MRSALRSTAFNNAVAADLIRATCLSLVDAKLVSELKKAAAQLDIDADTLEVFVIEIQEGRISRSL